VLASYWSKLATEGERDVLSQSVNRSLSTLFMVLLPVTVGLVLLRQPLISVVLWSDALDAPAALATSQVLAVLAISTVPAYAYRVIARVLFVEKATRALFLLSLVGMALSLVLMTVFVFLGLGVVGVALGTLSSGIVVLLAALAYVHRRFVILSVSTLVKTGLQTIIAATIMALVVLGIEHFIPSSVPYSDLALLIVGTLAGAVVYFALLRFLGHPEFKSIWHLIASWWPILRPGSGAV
jgi:putative peptidoglycan lipid II flippase